MQDAVLCLRAAAALAGIISGMGPGRQDDPHFGRDAELAELAQAVRDLASRVTRLEQMAGGAAAAPRLQVLPKTTRPTLESRLGSQYLNRAGILALLVGVSFAVHWAFSNNWIGAGAIIATGLIGGLAVVALGQWFLRRQYIAFGLSLQALGIGALYVVLWAGFQVYRVIPPVAALAGMIAIAAATATAAVLQDSELLAVFAFLGGFVTPFLLSTGQNRQIELFVYLLVLCSGMLVTLAFTHWSRLLAVSFFSTVAVTAAWYFSYYTAGQWLSTLVFASILFAIFVAGSLLVDRRSPFILVVVPTATAAYLAMADAIASRHIGLIEMLAGAGLLVISGAMPGRLRALYFTVGAACFGLAVPAEFDPHWTTSVIWLALGLLLMLIGFNTRTAFIRWDALVLIVITVLKVFIYDLSTLGAGYRIVAMAVLGIALLATSFVYQRNWLHLRRP